MDESRQKVYDILYPALDVCPKGGEERFHIGPEAQGESLLAFWRWAYSGIHGNTERGRLAEYIVAMALGVQDQIPPNWRAYDLETKDGIPVEVKASGYLQEWGQTKLTTPVFGIPKTRAWNMQDNTYAQEAYRQAQVYVFCLETCREQDRLDELDLSQWTFYVVRTAELDQKCGSAQTLSLSRLCTLEHIPCDFSHLAAAVQEVSAP